jgi:uncharacterized protein (TIGR01777 family)
MPRVLLTGGTGLIGQRLSRILEDRGYETAILSRRQESELQGNGIRTRVHYWNPDRREIDEKAVNSCDFIIHLAGANIGGKRWTGRRKKQILESRVGPADLIFEKLDPRNSRLKAFLSSSAVGYYGARTTGDVYRETNPPASDFLGETCRKWEQAADRFAGAGIRTVKIRTGVVLANNGGALKRMDGLFRLGLGSAIGSGMQFMPWIHIDDLCQMYIMAMEKEGMHGAYNAVAPEHVTNRTFSKELARVLRKPFWLPSVPAFIMKLIFGEMSVILLTGSRISSEKITEAGHKFQYPRLTDALREIYPGK